jgi:LacI family gluconate utilization system Gnt-I transcriptional repressor
VVEVGERADPVDMLVQMSSFETGRLMGEHLGRQGFSRIAFCGHTLGHGSARLEGFRSALAALRIAPALILPLEGTQSIADGIVSLGRLLDALPDCDATFYGSDLLAMGALIDARQRRLEVPGDLAIAGCGDLDFALHLDPPLTTIRVSDYEMGRLAGEMLRRRLDGQSVEVSIVEIPVQPEARKSTARQDTMPTAASS